MLVTVSPATGGFAGHMDNRERWVAARITCSHLNIMLNLIKKAESHQLTGEEFAAAKHLITHCQASAGVFLDGLHTATKIDDLIALNNEFYKMCCAKT